LTFPVVFEVGALRLPAHQVFESLGYFLGFRTYLALRRRWGDAIVAETRLTVIAAAAVGALFGSRMLAAVEDLAAWRSAGPAHSLLFGGRTIVGALLGGLVAVEWAKRRLGESRRTGDLFALPLCVGIAVGRIGCFLTGLADHTHGIPTALPWGVDFGDGVRRHPTQLYEIAALAGIAVWVWIARRRAALLSGDLFRGFLALYLAFRLALEWIKPAPRLYAGLSAIQVACVLGLLYYRRDLPRLFLVNRSRGDDGSSPAVPLL
jgi:prolipoprotein diacylglyceryltransferase